MKTLTDNQRRAVLAYAAENGRYWKAHLRFAWTYSNARIFGQISPELQQVRNTLGPTWLNRVSLKELQQQEGRSC